MLEQKEQDDKVMTILNISSVQLSDTGTYECCANIIGSNVTKSDSTLFDVKSMHYIYYHILYELFLGIPIVEVSTEYDISNGSQDCPTNTVCLYPGNNITINCISSEMLYNISGPGGIHQDHSLMITSFSNNREGNYTCSTSNICGETISTISLLMISEY